MKNVNMVYLGGPIDAIPKGEASGWRWEVADHLMIHGVSSYSPVHAFTWNQDQESARRIMDINFEAMLRCDAHLFLLPEGVESIGTVRELQWCTTRIGVNLAHVIVVRPSGVNRVYLSDVNVVSTFEEAVHLIASWNEGNECENTNQHETSPS